MINPYSQSAMDTKKEQQSPPRRANPRVHEEAAMLSHDRELQSARQKKKTKILVCAGIFFVLQAAVIMAAALVLFRVKTPRMRITSAEVQNLVVSQTRFDVTVVAEVAIRNRNYGKFKYEDGTVRLTYGGVLVGQGAVMKGNAKARKTRRLNVSVSSTNVAVDGSRLAADRESGVLVLRSEAKLKGKVHVLKVMKKGKTAEMNCTMALLLNTSSIQDFICE